MSGSINPLNWSDFSSLTTVSEYYENTSLSDDSSYFSDDDTDVFSDDNDYYYTDSSDYELSSDADYDDYDELSSGEFSEYSDSTTMSPDDIFSVVMTYADEVQAAYDASITYSTDSTTDSTSLSDDSTDYDSLTTSTTLRTTNPNDASIIAQTEMDTRIAQYEADGNTEAVEAAEAVKEAAEAYEAAQSEFMDMTDKTSDEYYEKEIECLKLSLTMIKAMKALQDIDSTYQPEGLPNDNLTELIQSVSDDITVKEAKYGVDVVGADTLGSTDVSVMLQEDVIAKLKEYTSPADDAKIKELTNVRKIAAFYAQLQCELQELTPGTEEYAEKEAQCADNKLEMLKALKNFQENVDSSLSTDCLGSTDLDQAITDAEADQKTKVKTFLATYGRYPVAVRASDLDSTSTESTTGTDSGDTLPAATIETDPDDYAQDEKDYIDDLRNEIHKNAWFHKESTSNKWRSQVDAAEEAINNYATLQAKFESIPSSPDNSAWCELELECLKAQKAMIEALNEIDLTVSGKPYNFEDRLESLEETIEEKEANL